MSGAQEPHKIHTMAGDRDMKMENDILKTNAFMGRLGSWELQHCSRREANLLPTLTKELVKKQEDQNYII